MRIAKYILAASLLLVGLTTSTVALGTGAGPGPPAPICQEGHTKGELTLPQMTPSGIKFGKMSGILKTRIKPKYELQAGLSLVPTPGKAGTAGEIKGKLMKLNGPGAKPTFFAKVTGQWTADKNGDGEFRMAIVKPGPTPLSPGKVIGAIKGHLKDGKMTPTGPQPGHYLGHWKICK